MRVLAAPVESGGALVAHKESPVTDMDAKDAWKTRKREIVYRFGKFGHLERHAVELPDGRVIDDWTWLELPNFVIVLAQTPDDRYLLFRQTKYAVPEGTLAPVGGYIEPGEDPRAAARRELEEELGCTADEFVSLGEYAVDANRGAGRAYLYLARGVVPMATQAVSDDLEAQERVTLTRAELAEALFANRFRAIAFATTVAMALLYTPSQP
jgi:ADP-ribose pyrophosphatase